MADLFLSNNDQLVELIGLTNNENGNFVNTATVIARVLQLDGAQVGTDIAMPYVAASDGDYRGQIDDAVASLVDTDYRVRVIADGDGSHGEWNIRVRGSLRQKT